MAAPPKQKGKVDTRDQVDGSTVEDDQRERGYYYDDAHGYEIYQDDDNEEDVENVTSALKIWTIGHSTRSLGEFIDLLTANNIDAVADVRSYPGSRKFPHFNAEALSTELANVSIDHRLIKELGGRRRSRPDSSNTVWRNEAFRGYADYMETEGFLEGISALLKLAAERRTAVMCAEAVWWRCHRSMIADYLRSRGLTVEHIMDEGQNVIHPFTSAAKIVDGHLVYGPAQ